MANGRGISLLSRFVTDDWQEEIIKIPVDTLTYIKNNPDMTAATAFECWRTGNPDTFKKALELFAVDGGLDQGQKKFCQVETNLRAQLPQIAATLMKNIIPEKEVKWFVQTTINDTHQVKHDHFEDNDKPYDGQGVLTDTIRIMEQAQCLLAPGIERKR